MKKEECYQRYYGLGYGNEGLDAFMQRASQEAFLGNPAPNQTLTFEEAEKAFDKKNVAFGESEFRTLGLVRKDGAYTNLALLLSDQCPYSIKAAIFQGNTKSIFRDRAEFGGSLFAQLENAFKYFSQYNKIYAYIENLNRIERSDYPPEAIREGLLNALIHRDYSFSGPILASLYEDRFEIISIGGIVPGLRMEDLLSGVSQSRNEKLSAIFYRLGYIEAYGTGIRRMIECYEGFVEKPKFAATGGSFSLTLPNMNERKNYPLSESEQSILSFLKGGDWLTRAEIAEGCKLGSTNAYNLLKNLAKKGFIEERKEGKKTAYRSI